MAWETVPARPEDLDAIAALLIEAFDANADAPFVDRRLLHWKYFEPFGEGSVPRSYVLKRNEEIVAHCVALPVPLRVPDGAAGSSFRMPAVTFLDWAARRDLPGPGAILMKQLMARFGVAVVAGGSEATRLTIPRLGFAQRGSIGIYARVVRPVRQFRTRPPDEPGWKRALRFARNVGWSRARLGAVQKGWRAVAVDRFAPPVTYGRTAVSVEHAAEYFDYWRRCPSARTAAFEIHRADEPVGWFLVSHTGGQARIAGMWLVDGTPESWRHAVRVAVQTAADDPSTCEVVCTACAPVEHATLTACGFHQRDTRPLFLFDPRGCLARAPMITWNLVDDDLAYVFDPAHPYYT